MSAPASAVPLSKIVKMVKDGVKPERIIAKVCDSGASYELTADQLSELRDEGVPRQVVAYLISTSPKRVVETPAKRSTLIKFYKGSYEEALAEARNSGKVLVIDVVTDSCVVCEQMDKYTFNDPRVAKTLNDNFVNIRLDLTGNPLEIMVVTESYKVRDFPTLLFVNDAERVISRHQGFHGPQEVIDAANAAKANKDKPVPANRQ